MLCLHFSLYKINWKWKTFEENKLAREIGKDDQKMMFIILDKFLTWNAQNKDRFYHRAKNMEQTSQKCQKAINLNSFKKGISSFLKTEWFNSVLDFEIDKLVFFSLLHICCGLILCFCHEWTCLLILTFKYLKYYNDQMNSAQNYFVFFPYVRLLHLSCIVLSCPVLSWLVFVLLRGCNKCQAFAFRCISSILCLWFLMILMLFDFVFLVEIKLNWTELISVLNEHSSGITPLVLDTDSLCKMVA